MDSNGKYYSFRKSPKTELLIGFSFISLAVLGFFIGYRIADKFFFNYNFGKSYFQNFSKLYTVKLLNLIINICLIIIVTVVVGILLWLLIKGIIILFQRERVILAKVTRISTEQIGEYEDSTDFTNASLSKALAKNFKQVTIHQKASKGRIEKICIYASQARIFFYPSSSDIFYRLAGTFSNFGMEIVPFEKGDFDDYQKDLDLQYGNPTKFQVKGLSIVGEPANQHIKKFVTPVDGLVERIVKLSQDVEIHTFSNLRQGSKLKFWLRKKTLPRTTDKDGRERNLSKKQLHRISETEDMETSGYVHGEVSVVLKGYDSDKVLHTQNQLLGSLDSAYDGFTRKIKVMSLKPKYILRNIKNHRLVNRTNKLISGYSGRAIIDVYRRPISGIPFVKDITTPPSEQRPIETHPIVLGETITGEQLRISYKDFIHHCGIFGTSGYGKSEWVSALIEQIHSNYPTKRKIILDFSGEHAKRFATDPDFLILEANNPNAPLHINPFQDDFVNENEHITSLNKFFHETLSIDSTFTEFTPAQKQMLWGGILTTVKANSEDRNYPSFKRKIREFIDHNRKEFINPEWSRRSLLNKLNLFERELREIVFANKSNLNMNLLKQTNIIVNLKSLRSNVAKRAIGSLILYQLQNYLLKTAPAELEVLVFIEEASIVVPGKGNKRKDDADMLFAEECLTAIRKHGAGFILIGVSAEKITEFIFDSKFFANFSCISRVLSLNMNYEDIRDIHSLKKFQCDVKLPNEEFPIRLVQLIRPTRKKLSDEEYSSLLKSHPKYIELSNQSYLLEDADTELIEMQDNARLKEEVENLGQNCLSKCSFLFSEKGDCLLFKKTKLAQILKESSRRFVIQDYNGWENISVKLNDDFSDFLDSLSIMVNTSIDDELKMGKRAVTNDDRRNLTKCAFQWILQGLMKEELLSFTEAFSFLIDYDSEIEKLQTSSYGFDTKGENYNWRTETYEEYFQD